MANRQLSSMATSIFCENLAMMFGAGIPSDEAMELLAEGSDEDLFHDAVHDISALMGQGMNLGEAIRESGRLPDYAATAIGIGETAGRTEQTLRSLATFYDELDGVEQRMRSALVYPTALLFLMAAILAVMLFAVLPTFTSVYQSLAGGVSTSSYGYITTATVIIWVALVVTLLLAVVSTVAAVAMNRSNGLLSSRTMRIMWRLPFLRRELDSLVRARFAGVLSTLISSGLNADEAFHRAYETVETPAFAACCKRCMDRMVAGESLAHAAYAESLFEPLYARMLIAAAKTGQIDGVLGNLSALYYEDARTGIDGVIDAIEPTLAGFLAVAVGLSLLAIMLPLIGIMGGIG